MNTNYQMWITGNAEQEKLQIPVLPEKFTVSIGSKNSSVDVVGLGEITIKQSRPAYQFSFSSFFPPTNFPGIENVALSAPQSCVNRIEGWIDGDKPVHVIITGVGVNAYCTIEKFTHYEQGGDVGTIYYDLSLKEYREVTIRQVTVAGDTATVEKPAWTTPPCPRPIRSKRGIASGILQNPSMVVVQTTAKSTPRTRAPSAAIRTSFIRARC